MAQVTDRFQPQPEYLAAERALASDQEPGNLQKRAIGLIFDPVSRGSQKNARAWALPLALYGALALAVMLPMLTPGYILTLDMAFTPELRMPENISSSYLFHAALHYLNFVLPGDIIQKILLLTVLILSGLGAHFLVRHIQASKNRAGEFASWGAFIAGAIYMINPFTYSRFMAGQYAVLLGYALLPFFMRSLLRFFAVPTFNRMLAVTGWAIVISIVSVHTLGLLAILTTAAVAACAWKHRHNQAAVTYAATGLIIFVLASGYWLLPLIGGSSNQGQAVSGFTTSDQQAFQTTGGDLAGQIGNVLQLQGFWAEGRGLYLLPQDQLPGWVFVVLAVWFLVGAGLRWIWQRRRPTALFISASALAAITLSVTGTDDWHSALAGFREPHKFIGLLALAYALLAGLGAASLLKWAKRRSEKTFSVLAVALLIIPVLFTPTMFWGFAGQLSAREYPADWHQINNQLNQDTSDFRVLSLPWHLYMSYPFAGRIIVNPSEQFFDKPVIASNELEFKGASPTFPDADKKLLGQHIMPTAAGNPHLGEEFGKLNIKYVLLAKTFDYQDYEYLDHHSDMRLISETRNLKLYRNLAYEQ